MIGVSDHSRGYLIYTISSGGHWVVHARNTAVCRLLAHLPMLRQKQVCTALFGLGKVNNFKKTKWNTHLKRVIILKPLNNRIHKGSKKLNKQKQFFQYTEQVLNIKWKWIMTTRKWNYRHGELWNDSKIKWMKLRWGNFTKMIYCSQNMTEMNGKKGLRIWTKGGVVVVVVEKVHTMTRHLAWGCKSDSEALIIKWVIFQILTEKNPVKMDGFSYTCTCTTEDRTSIKLLGIFNTFALDKITRVNR